MTLARLDLEELHGLRVDAVMTVPVTSDGDLVVVQLCRGVELPGGMVEPTDEGLVEAARREAWEEACIELDGFGLAALLRVASDEQHWNHINVAVYAGRVTRLAPFVREAESLARFVVSPDVYVNHATSFGVVSDRAEILREALAALERRSEAA